MESIFDLVKSEAMLFKYGSGTGTDLGKLRSTREKLSGGGTPSGPLSFFKVFDTVAGIVKSGGKCLALDQPVYTVAELKTAKELAEFGGKFLVASYTKAKLLGFSEPGGTTSKWASAWFSGEKLVVKVVCEHGCFHVSEDHPFMLYDGSVVRAGDLESGDKLYPLGAEKNFVKYYADSRFVVQSVEPLGVQPVVSIEVEDDEPDDKRPWSEHNYAIAPMGSTGDSFDGVAVLNTRRAARMQILQDWHPDVLDFIDCKYNEEKKAKALIAQGYEANFNGEAYSSIAFQNTNISVRLSDMFMTACEEGDDWTTREVLTGKPVDTFPASDMLDRIADRAWHCGDPGVQYHDTIQKWHTIPNTAPILGTNPCAEFIHIDDSACNLASTNLMKFLRDDGEFDCERYAAANAVFITAQEIVVAICGYPTKKIAENSHKSRPLGLGYANLGALLMSKGIPYDSDAGRNIAASITALMLGSAYAQSARAARAMGAFEYYAANQEPMMRVMGMHLAAAEAIPSDDAMKHAAVESIKLAVNLGYLFGYRNSQADLLAPTGTIGFLMDCDTTGVEPDIALVKYKSLAGRGVLKIVNQTVPLALKTLGYDSDCIDRIVAHIDEHDTIVGSELKDEHLPVFDCAFAAPNDPTQRSIHYMGHVKMMAAVQPFLSGAISKTVNLPKDADINEIKNVYFNGWKLGLKCLAVYRDGSKDSQPLNTKADSDSKAPLSTEELDRRFAALKTIMSSFSKEAGLVVGDDFDAFATENLEKLAAWASSPSRAFAEAMQEVKATPAFERRRLPDTRQAITHKFTIQGHEGYINVGLFDDGSPGELFITMAKEGSTIGGLVDAIGTLTSISLQSRVPLETLVNKFAHTRFEPSGFTKNRDIPIAKSVVDYIFRWLGMQFVPGYWEANSPVAKLVEEGETPVRDHQALLAEVQKRREHKVVPVIAEVNGNGNGHAKVESANAQFAKFQSDAPACPTCGSITVRNATCYRCFNCGDSLGCS